MEEIFKEISERYKIPVEKVGEKYKEFASTVYSDIKGMYPNEVDGFIEGKVSEYFVKNVKDIFELNPYAYIQSVLEMDKDKPIKERRITDYKSIVLSVSDPDDDNSFRKYQNTSVYYGNKKKGVAPDPNGALERKLVREEQTPNGKTRAIPIYENKFKVDREGKEILDDNGNPIPNPDYGKDIPDRLMRKMLVLVDQRSLGRSTDGWALMNGKIPADKDCDPRHFPAVMSKTILYGRVFKDPYLTVRKDGCDNDGFIKSDDVNVWELAELFLPRHPAFMRLSDVANLDFSRRNMWICKANVSAITPMEKKVVVEVNSEDLVNGIRASTDYDPLMQFVERVVQVGSEVYIIAETRQFKKDDEFVNYNRLFGIVPSLEEDLLQKAIHDKLRK